MASSDTIPVGIDLGTTFSAVAYLDSAGRPITLRNSEGDLTTPSVVFLDRTSAIVGVEASDAGVQEPDRLATFAKRDVGEQVLSKALRGEHIPAEVIQAIILKKLKADAELKLGPISKAVVTVPAFFNDPCRKATLDAARLAGLELIDVINEPTAAAITYGIEKGFLNSRGESLEDETVLVYDLGGGTFDVTVMSINGSDFTAKASAGDVYLGGCDFDQRLCDFVANQYQAEFGEDLRNDESALQELLQKANSAKHALTSRDSVSFFFNHQGNRFRTEVTREQFQQLTQDLVERTRLTVESVLAQCRMTWGDLSRILLVGGSTRMPAVIEMLESCFGKPIDRSLSPDEAVAHGAALYAGLCLNAEATAGYGMSVKNVSSHDLGVLGVNSTGRKRRRVMIPRNSLLPAKRTERFMTAKENQKSVKVEIVEGGDDSGLNSTAIGRCIVRDLPENLPEKTPVDVQFEYGTNGRLVVHAKLPDTGTEAVLNLDRASGLSEERYEYWKERINAGFGDDTVESPLTQDSVEQTGNKVPEIVTESSDNAPTALEHLIDVGSTAIENASKQTLTEPVAPKPSEKKSSWKDRRKKLNG